MLKVSLMAPSQSANDLCADLGQRRSPLDALQEAGAQGQAGRGVELLGDLLQHSSCALKLHLLQPLLHGLQECTGLWQSHRLQRMHP